jgi:signal transduction histidine kinase
MRLNLSLKYIFSTTVILLAVMGITLGIISIRHEELVMEQMKIQAKALFQQIVITRRWIADHGGVFVEKLPWVEANPYLKNSHIIDREGKEYVKENPAMVTKQLSQYAQKDKLYSFHITSLKLMNPENKPDAFEENALRVFDEKKIRELSKIEKLGGSHYYRYIAPLYVEEACLECHAKQGYKVGDIRGAISISVPMDYAFSVISSDRKNMVYSGVLMVAVLMAFLYVMTGRMVINPIRRIRAFMADFSKTGKPDFPVLRTNDEVEDLCRSFIDMAKAIDGYHSCLQEKIKEATDELTEKNEALLRLNRTKSDFIANISHELRTPLTSIKGAMDYLSVRLARRGKSEEEDLSVFFEVIRKNAERLIRLVNNVLEYERIELGAFEMRFREVNLRNIFEEVITGFRSEALQKKVAIRLQAEDLLVTADEDRMKQVMINLISNALNFSPEFSVIVVSLREDDGHAVVSVTDSGRGIDENELGLVFRQFYSKGMKNGTGLGLTICKGIIEAHNGEIGAESTVGRGSCFYFRIPKQRREKDDKTTACCR